MTNINLQKMHKISIIWGIIMMLLVLALTVIAISYKKETKEYKDFEFKSDKFRLLTIDCCFFVKEAIYCFLV